MLSSEERSPNSSANTTYDEVATEKAPKLWGKAKKFKDLLKLNRKFLQGELYATPHSLGPLDDESSQILDKLLQVNSLGVLSDESQPSLDSDTKIQRGYLSGFLQADFGKFCKALEKSGLEYFTQVVDESKDPRSFLTLTEDRWAVTKIIKNGKWKVVTGIPSTLLPDRVSETEFYNTSTYKLDQDDRVIYFNVVDPDWNKPVGWTLDTFMDVVKALND